MLRARLDLPLYTDDAGTAISALTTAKLAGSAGTAAPFMLVAALLTAHAMVAALTLPDAPSRLVAAEPLTRRLAAALRPASTGQAAILYAVTFGGYVACSLYLPAYLATAYGLTQADAVDRMAGFLLLAVVMRPVGGWLSDRFAAIPVLAVALAVLTGAIDIQAFTPGLEPLGTIALLAMAAALGTGSGATLALLAQRAPANRIGSVTGVVGAAGGLGGFVPPLVMGAIDGRYHNYTLGLAALATVVLGTLILTVAAVARANPDGVPAV